MSNYYYGNCVLTIEGDENIYPVVPFDYTVELVRNTGYLKDGFIYIFRGDISRRKKFKSGLFTDAKGSIIFAMSPDEKELYSAENIRDDSIHSILLQANRINPKIQNKLMKEIRNSSDIYMPELDENDDFLKHLVKLMLRDKKISLKDYKDKFKKSHDITNIKASLDTKTSPDGKRGALTINNLLKWLEILDMDISIEFKDNKHSLDPTNKIFKYSSEDGYEVIDLASLSEEDNDDYDIDVDGEEEFD